MNSRPKTKCFFRFIDDEGKNTFKQSSCLLMISVGQWTHEGEHLSSTMDLINDSFQSCILLVDDSLQRHTMAIGRKQEADFCHKISIKEGGLWLERNENNYNKLGNLKKNNSMGFLVESPQVRWAKKFIKNLIDKDKTYTAAFYNSVDEFVTKYRHWRMV